MLRPRTEAALTSANGDQISPDPRAPMWTSARAPLPDSPTSRVSIAFKVILADYANIKAARLNNDDGYFLPGEAGPTAVDNRLAGQPARAC